MNYTPEQIAAAQALLASLEPKKPMEHWVVINHRGNVRATFTGAREAEYDLVDANKHGNYAPYTLHHMREVIA